MIAVSGSNSPWTAEDVSNNALKPNSQYGMAVRAGSWSPEQGTGTEFTIEIGLYDGGWNALTKKTFTGRSNRFELFPQRK